MSAKQRVVVSVVWWLGQCCQLLVAHAREETKQIEQLLERAVVADRAGQDERYEQLLSQILRIDPDCERARWRLGQIYFRDRWRSLETIGRIVTHDSKWQEYRLRRETASDNPESHAALARWCQGAKLEHEAKWHWHEVLKSHPDHREALGSLGLRRYQEGFYTNQEIEQLAQQQKQEKRDFKRYQQQFSRLVKQARRSSPQQRKQKLAELAASSDPVAVPALFALMEDLDQKIGRAGELSENSFEVHACQAIVSALSDMPEHAATERLLSIAVFASHPRVRRRAAHELRYREPTSYMPQLMISLTAPLKSDHSIRVLPNGQVSLIEDVYQAGPLKEFRETRSSQYRTQYVVRENANDNSRRFERPATRLVSDPKRDLQSAKTRVAETAARVQEENKNSSTRNARVVEVLEIVTDQQFGNDPQAWWTAWQRYNELYVPETLPVVEKYYEDDYRRIVQPRSCFVAGTPVWTQAGPVSIERLQVGDLVLSQDPVTGRLDYLPVIETTVRPPSPVVELAFDEESITTTLGHRFWVTGKGWQMAKFLATGQRLITTSGSVDLRSTHRVEKAAAYNLVVKNYHTYFVGLNRLLVHDNNCPRPLATTRLGVSKIHYEPLASR